MGIMFIFISMAIIRNISQRLDRDGEVAQEANRDSQNTINNYFPLVFHVIISAIIIASLFLSNVLTEEKIDILLSDVSFQFYSTYLLVIISLISPFTSLSLKTHEKLAELTATIDNRALQWVLRGNNDRIAKGLICLALVAYFIYFDYLKIPNLTGGYFSGLTIFLIFYYLLNNIIQLIKNPVRFRNANMSRLTLLFNSIKTSVFFLIGGVVFIFIPTEIAGWGVGDKINPLVFLLFGYNILMARNEYKFLRLKKVYANQNFNQ